MNGADLRRRLLAWCAGRPRARALALLAPGTLWLVLFFLAPLALMFAYSFMPLDEHGAHLGFTLEHYHRFLFEPVYREIFARTLVWSVGATVICLLLGYPVAYAITRSGRFKSVLLFLVVLPFWTSFLVRTFAMIFLMTGEGLINTLLRSWSFAPLDMMNTDFALMTGLVYCHLPFMVLPIYASLEKLDRSLLEAAEVLGTRPAQCFLRITLPLSKPGLLAGSGLVFVLTLGNFLISDLLGSASAMIGNVIDQQFKATRNWPFGSAASFVVVTLVLIPTLAYLRAQERSRAGGT